MSGKDSIKRRLDNIEDDLKVGDDYVDVELKFHESMKIPGHDEPIILRMKRSEAELLKWQMERKADRKTEDEEADDEPGSPS